MEFSKLMAIGGVSVPAHCRGNVGVCLAICIQAIEWRMSPYAVANKSYVVNDRLCYESQLVHAVIEQRAPLTQRLRHTFAGDGGKLTCTIIGYVRGESEPMTYTSSPIEQITPKNSPLWKTKPALQLYYNALRDWARMYFPDVIMGVYTDDEIATSGPASNGGERSRLMTAAARLSSTAAQAAAASTSDERGPSEGDAGSSATYDALAEYRGRLETARTAAEAAAIYDAEFGPGAALEWSPEHDAVAAKLRDERVAAIGGK
jgi:hypothetical protein